MNLFTAGLQFEFYLDVFASYLSRATFGQKPVFVQAKHEWQDVCKQNAIEAMSSVKEGKTISMTVECEGASFVSVHIADWDVESTWTTWNRFLSLLFREEERVRNRIKYFTADHAKAEGQHYRALVTWKW